MNRQVLRGVSGVNPLGFLAALGILRVCDRGSASARLGFLTDGSFRAFLEGFEGDLVARVAEDAASGREKAAWLLEYAKEEKKSTKTVADLKAPPEIFKTFMQRFCVKLAGRRWRRCSVRCSVRDERGRRWQKKHQAHGVSFHRGQPAVPRHRRRYPRLCYVCLGARVFVRRRRCRNPAPIYGGIRAPSEIGHSWRKIPSRRERASTPPSSGWRFAAYPCCPVSPSAAGSLLPVCTAVATR